MRMLSASRGIAAAVFLTLLLAADAFPSQGGRARARIRQRAAADCSSVGDEVLAARVRHRLSKVRSLRGRKVAVRAEGGAVTLAGRLGTRRRRLGALRAARSVPCVKSAVNALPCGPGEHLCVAGPKEGECLPNDTPCPTDLRRRE